MDLAKITMARDEARAAYLDWRAGDTDEDAEIARGYRALAAGHDVIRLDDTITAGGADDRGLPRLAIMRADMRWAYLNQYADGSFELCGSPRPAHNRTADRWQFPADTLPRRGWKDLASRWWRLRAMVPAIPPRLRPRHALRNYAILWEVEEWATAPAPPGDPALLKHLGGQLYAVLAVWDLTPLERAVLAGRLA